LQKSGTVNLENVVTLPSNNVSKPVKKKVKPEQSHDAKLGVGGERKALKELFINKHPFSPKDTKMKKKSIFFVISFNLILNF